MLEHKATQSVWINCAKMAAIMAVLIDHLKGVLYQSEDVQYVVFFSVTVFFFLSGMTSWYSMARSGREEGSGRWILRRLLKILTPYLLAVCVYQFLKSGYQFNLPACVLWFINFNIDGQFYFILIYIQLIVVSPLLYLLILRCMRSRFSIILRLILVVVTAMLSWYFVNHTFVLETYGGGKSLFGGTYLLVYLLGMLAAGRKPVPERLRHLLLSFVLSLLASAATLIFMLTNRFALDTHFFEWKLKVNPPGITILLYSLALIWFIRSACMLTERTCGAAGKRILSVLQFPGKYTLYIFMYHMLILEWLNTKATQLHVLPIPVRFPVYLLIMAGLPIAGKLFYDWCRRKLTA